MAILSLRWGILSTARINQALIPILKKSERNQLVAVASRNPARAEAYAREWNIPRAFGSYEAMLADPGIDVVYISLPNTLHAEWTIRAVESGKHVLCEKPLAMSVEEVKAIRAASEKAGRIVAEGFMYRHHPQTLKVKELIESGAIGHLRLVRSSFRFNLTRRGDIRLDPSVGGGSIWDAGCYPISYCRCVVGQEPEEVFGWQIRGASGVDEIFTGQMRFPNEVFGQFDSGFRSTYHEGFEVIGSEGNVQVHRAFKPGRTEEIYLVQGDHTETISVQAQELYEGEVEDIADAILLGKPPRIGLADSQGNVATIVALLDSARLDKPVPVH